MRSLVGASAALAFAASTVVACSYDFDKFAPLETTGESTSAGGTTGAGGSRGGASGSGTSAGSGNGGFAGSSAGGSGGSAGTGSGGDLDGAVDSRPMNDGAGGSSIDAAMDVIVTKDTSVDNSNDAPTNDASDAGNLPDASVDVADASMVDAAPERGCLGDACGACVPSAECSCASFGGHVYRFCTTARSWADAETQCSFAGMRLARVDGATENGFIRSTADALGSPLNMEIWIGIQDPSRTLQWQWPDGTEFWMGGASGGPVGGLYADWDVGRPTGQSQRNCGSMLPSSAAWFDRSCTSLLPYVCELY